MAPGVLLVAAGGMQDGGLGTSYDTVEAGAARGDAGRSVRGRADRPRLGGPHGRVGAGPARRGRGRAGADRGRTVRRGCGRGRRHGARGRGPGDGPGVGGARRLDVRRGGRGDPRRPTGASRTTASLRATAVLRNPLGLHARPAAVVARMLAAYDAKVRGQRRQRRERPGADEAGRHAGRRAADRDGGAAGRARRATRWSPRSRAVSARSEIDRCCEQPHMNMRPVQSCSVCKVAPRAEHPDRRARPRAA